MKIPISYNNFKIGEVVEFNESNGKMTLQLDLTKDNAKLIKEMIMQGAPISMACYNEPIYANQENCSLPPDNDLIEDGFGSAWSAWCPTCGKKEMCVVRPGRCQCNNCG